MHALLKPLYRVRRTLATGSIRELVFGFEDGVVQNMTLIAGMVGAQLSTRVIGAVATINGIAGVLSMSMGTYLSSKAEQDVLPPVLDGPPSRSPARDAAVMAAAYAGGALVPVVPFLIGLSGQGIAMATAILLTGMTLFGLGMLKAVLSRQNRLRSGLEMMVLASATGLAGYFIGVVAQRLFDLNI